MALIFSRDFNVGLFVHGLLYTVLLLDTSADPLSVTRTLRSAVKNENHSNLRAVERACQTYKENRPLTLQDHIIGRENAEIGEFPHMAAIGFSKTTDSKDAYAFLCGGSLIHKKFVLTAAYCVEQLEWIPQVVRLGFVNLTDTEEINNAVTVKIAKIHIHPEYSRRIKDNDIAILELESEVELSEKIAPACVCTGTETPNANENYYVTGWGRTSPNGAHLKSLQKVALKTEPIERCRSVYENYTTVPDTNICAYDPEMKRDGCTGFAGGPLNKVIDSGKSLYCVMGISSRGVGCVSGIPGLYTKVSEYLDFIENIVWK